MYTISAVTQDRTAPRLKPLSRKASAAIDLPKVQFRGVLAQQVSEKLIWGIFGKEASQQLLRDFLGLLLPKMLIARGKEHRTEEAVLECAENVPFYLTIPVIGTYVFGPLFRKLANRLGGNIQEIGEISKPLSCGNRYRLGTKAGVLLSSIAVAGGLEYLVPTLKNIITANAYKVKNFTAVAGLEPGRLTLKNNEEDPILKAKHRLPVVIGSVLGTIGLSFLLPSLILKSTSAARLAQGLTKYIDFGKKGHFDMSKPLLAILAFIGLGAYLDFSRSQLERKENRTRVLFFTIPYYMVGAELAGNFLAWITQHLPVSINGQKSPLSRWVQLLYNKASHSGNDNPKASFLDWNKVLGKEQLEQAVNKLHLPETAKTALKSSVLSRLKFIDYGKLALSATVVGLISNLYAYSQTRKSFREENPTAVTQSNTCKTVSPVTPDRNIQTIPAFFSRPQSATPTLSTPVASVAFKALPVTSPWSAGFYPNNPFPAGTPSVLRV